MLFKQARRDVSLRWRRLDFTDDLVIAEFADCTKVALALEMQPGDATSHDAGYDAFMTGAVFIRALQYADSKSGLETGDCKIEESGTVSELAHALKLKSAKHITNTANHLYMMASDTIINIGNSACLRDRCGVDNEILAGPDDHYTRMESAFFAASLGRGERLTVSMLKEWFQRAVPACNDVSVMWISHPASSFQMCLVRLLANNEKSKADKPAAILTPLERINLSRDQVDKVVASLTSMRPPFLVTSYFDYLCTADAFPTPQTIVETETVDFYKRGLKRKGESGDEVVRSKNTKADL